mgnify:CR=1 FL=1
MLSDNIRNYRKINNMSQDELAEKVSSAILSKPGWVTFKSRADERYLRISIQNIGGTAGFSYLVSVN